MANQSIFAAFERMWQHTMYAIKNCAPADGVAYVYEEDVEADTVPFNADTLGGNLPEYYAQQSQLDTTNDNLTSLQDVVNLNKSAFDLFKASFIDSIYPVGSIYMSVSSTNPASLFGGTWTQLKDKFLLGAGSSYTAGSTGGEETHKLTVSEIPSHSHGLWSRAAYTGGGNHIAHCNEANAGDYSYTTGTKGGGEAHNNMPPYLAVYMWKRTA